MSHEAAEKRGMEPQTVQHSKPKPNFMHRLTSSPDCDRYQPRSFRRWDIELISMELSGVCIFELHRYILQALRETGLY